MEIIAHCAIAILIQLLLVRLCGSWTGGAAAATAWVISREITQAEYRWIELYGSGLRANMPWWGGLDIRVWHKIDPWLDWLVPTMMVFAAAFLARARRRKALTSR
jgi:hypothetical protein